MELSKAVERSQKFAQIGENVIFDKNHLKNRDETKRNPEI